MPGGRATLLGLICGVLFAPGRASAAELAFSGPGTCDERERLREDAERLIGAPLESVEGARFEVAVTESP